MNDTIKRTSAILAILLLFSTGELGLLAADPHRLGDTAQEFIGPFPSWEDVKRDYGAVGDGQVDDTDALQESLDDLHREDRKFFVLYVPAGTYRVTRKLVLFREKHNEPKDTAPSSNSRRYQRSQSFASSG